MVGKNEKFCWQLRSTTNFVPASGELHKGTNQRIEDSPIWFNYPIGSTFCFSLKIKD